nr:MAG TPA: hypothetical protein [Caudoviricetes sp.]DAY51036.1 MAG TPA: hypothetical protein [Caudoviricetes sp.]
MEVIIRDIYISTLKIQNNIRRIKKCLMNG